VEDEVAGQTKKAKKENAVLRYFRETRAELRKVRWPTLEQGWSMTKLVLAVTVLMALFLGVMDFFFGWLLQGVIRGQPLFIALSVAAVLALLGAAVLIGRGDEV
jgi:preprotein translocase subunit SecE